jgi:DsbC/DsbD-like thiol-disulfide interchange protein
MKKLFAISFGLVMMNMASGQVRNPVQWDFSAKKINATTYEVYLTANMEDGWHVYSQHTPDGGPVATTIQFAKNPLLALKGAAKETGKKEQKFEDLFGVDVIQFSDKVVFVQQIEVKGKAKTSLTGSVEFMTCNDRECLPPTTQKFSIALK